MTPLLPAQAVRKGQSQHLVTPSSRPPWGHSLGYRISWEEYNRTNTRVTHYLPNVTLEYRVTGLTALTTYTIEVAAMTAKGQGQVSASTISSGVPPGGCPLTGQDFWPLGVLLLTKRLPFCSGTLAFLSQSSALPWVHGVLCSPQSRLTAHDPRSLDGGWVGFLLLPPVALRKA